MTSKKQKERKNKNREKIAKERVLKRRETLRKQRKQAVEEKIEQLKAEENAFGKQKPFIKNDVSAINQVIKTSKKGNYSEDLTAKLEHNLKILEALEEEHDRESETRKEINRKLENEGHLTMKEKMDALHQKALELEGKAEQMEMAQKEFDSQNKEVIIDAVTTEVVEETQDSTSDNTEISQNAE
jgi:hypothetical protein